jgi:hypothetical protein
LALKVYLLTAPGQFAAFGPELGGNPNNRYFGRGITPSRANSFAEPSEGPDCQESLPRVAKAPASIERTAKPVIKTL